MMKVHGTSQDWRNSVLGALLFVMLSPLWIPALVLWLVYQAASFVCLHFAVWTFWLPQRKRLLFVYSDSPVWQAHIEERILPRIRGQAIVLNWSQRKQWSMRQALAVAIFRHFGGRDNFNPMAVVFHPFCIRRTFRFFQPFRDFKRGKPAALSQIESEFFQYLNIEARS